MQEKTNYSKLIAFSLIFVTIVALVGYTALYLYKEKQINVPKTIPSSTPAEVNKVVPVITGSGTWEEAKNSDGTPAKATGPAPGIIK